jgi:hypothetical protein
MEFCLFTHRQLPLVCAKVVKIGKDEKEWILRYRLPIDKAVDPAPVIRLLDVALGAKCKASGIYATTYEDVVLEFRKILESAGTEPEDLKSKGLSKKAKICRILAACTVLGLWIFVQVLVVPPIVLLAIVGFWTPFALYQSILESINPKRIINKILEGVNDR